MKILKERFIILALLLSLVSVFAVTSISRAQEEPSSYIYKSVLIESGDTLNKLASEYLSETDLSHTKLVSEIIRINRLPSDEITAGAYIVIPVCS